MRVLRLHYTRSEGLESYMALFREDELCVRGFMHRDFGPSMWRIWYAADGKAVGVEAETHNLMFGPDVMSLRYASEAGRWFDAQGREEHIDTRGVQAIRLGNDVWPFVPMVQSLERAHNEEQQVELLVIAPSSLVPQVETCSVFFLGDDQWLVIDAHGAEVRLEVKGWRLRSLSAPGRSVFSPRA